MAEVNNYAEPEDAVCRLTTKQPWLSQLVNCCGACHLSANKTGPHILFNDWVEFPQNVSRNQHMVKQLGSHPTALTNPMTNACDLKTASSSEVKRTHNWGMPTHI